MSVNNFEYIVNGKRVKLPVNPNKIAVRFRDSISQVERRTVIDPKPEVGAFDNRYEIPNEKLTVIDVPAAPHPAGVRMANAAGALNADPNVEQALPVFDLGSNQAVATDRLIVGFKPETTAVAEEIIRDNGGEITDAAGNEYIVRLKPDVNPFDAIAELMKRNEIEYAEPDFVTIGRHTPLPPDGADNNDLPDGDNPAAGNDNPVMNAPDESELAAVGSFAGIRAGGAARLAAEAAIAGEAETAGIEAAAPDPFERFKYAARITRAVEAWNLVAPSRNIRIAVLDEGTDINHPDLAPSIQGTFDAKDNDSDQQPNDWDGHGTACAGLAAALPHNAQGYRGIAHGCSIMAARIAYSESEGADWTTTNSMIMKAIDWAWQNGADVLSNSWGGGAPSNAIINAFERARTQGRGGKGCVIVIAAGNHSGPVEFPATLPNVLTVSASNEFDEPKTKTSADGEDWWGSNFGPEVDVAAPGVNNYTTDISGTAGYNTGGTALDDDYVSNFNGTSSATPIVAGVAALVLSANPNLREASVRRIIKQTADKVGQVVYTNGRNDRMGNGRVNAKKAVQMAPTTI
jgi:subtilisin family serine protease